MKYTPPKFDTLQKMAAIDVARLSEDEARKVLENLRWHDGITCIHCGSIRVCRINGKSAKVRDGLLQCNDCRKQFTVTVGTIMEDSHITLRQWVQAFHAMCASKKGVSALQLKRNLGLGSYKSAWFLCHRIRLAMSNNNLAKMSGIVEVDETYVGGKPRKGLRDENGTLIINKRGRGTKKIPVVALIQRDGNMVAKVFTHVTAETLKEAIRANVQKDAIVMTDELPYYKSISPEFNHQSVNHSAGEYSRNGINCNSNESYFALLKRGVHGTFHHVSETHLQRYCNEFSFRWDNRKTNDGERTVNAINGAWGKRLSYKPLTHAA